MHVSEVIGSRHKPINTHDCTRFGYFAFFRGFVQDCAISGTINCQVVAWSDVGQLGVCGCALKRHRRTSIKHVELTRVGGSAFQNCQEEGMQRAAGSNIFRFSNFSPVKSRLAHDYAFLIST